MNGRPTILYIDDEKANLTAFQYQFEPWYEVMTAESGDEALVTLSRVDADVVIADQRMPGMTGTELLERIRIDHPGCIRMILTGYSDIEAVVDALNRGRAFHYFKKPWDEAEVRTVIQHALDALDLEDRLHKAMEQKSESFEISSDAVSCWRPPEGVCVDLPEEEQIGMLWDSVCVDANPASVRELGMPSLAELVGIRLRDLVVGDPYVEAMKLFVGNGYRLDSHPTELLTTTGEQVHLLVSWQGVVQDGVLDRIWASAKNIDELKQAEDELRRHQEQLEKLVAERTDELERANRALAINEKKFRTIYETAPVGIAQLDLEGRPRITNTALQQMLGYTGEELASMVFTEFTHPADANSNMELYQELVAGTRDSYSMVKRYFHKDGHIIWGNLRVAMAGGGDDERTVIGIVEDISERKAAEDKLRASEERYRLFYENSPEATFIAEAETGRFVYVNESGCRLLGRTREEVLEMQAMEVHPPEARDRMGQLFAEVAQGSVRFLQGVPCVRKDGSPVFVDISAGPIELEGRPQVLGVFRDVTERQKWELKLREVEQRHRTLLDKAPIGIWEADADGSGRYINPKAAEIMGISGEQTAGTGWTSALHPDDAAAVFEAWTALVKEGTPYNLSYRFVHDSGDIRWVHGQAEEVRNSDDERLGFIGVLIDQSEQVLAQDEKQQLEEQLRQSQKMEAIGQLAGGVAHDFNNLLTVINFYAVETMESLSDSDPKKEDLRMVVQAADKAEGLTQQLLAFSRKQVWSPSVLNLNAVVANIDKMLRRLIGEDVELVVVLDPQLGNVRADTAQLELALVNLAVNARDAMPGGGKLTVETANVEIDEQYAKVHPDTQPGAYVMVAVTDTGGGIPLVVQDRIFEPFFTTKEKGKGTGLGLSTVYGIVHQAGGAIALYSEMGWGSTFRSICRRSERR